MSTTALERLAADARAERLLVARGLTDARSMREVIWPAFRREAAPWAELEYAQDVVGPRLLRTVRSDPPRTRPTVVLVSNPTPFHDAALAVPFEQPGRDRLPAGWADADGRWAPIYVQPIVAVYNHFRALPPREWIDLADPELRGRLVLDDPRRMLTAGPALAELSRVLGEATWTALIEGIVANEPHLVADNERSVLEVATGSRWTGLANWNVARRVRPGSPVRHVFLAPTPCVPGFGVLVRDAPAQALGRLFLAWLTSEGGQRAYAATGRIPAMPDVAAPLSLATVLPRGVEPLFGRADWLARPDAWVARFAALLPREAEPPVEGKLPVPGRM